MKNEESAFYDKKGKRIHEFAVLKVFHFRENKGSRSKNHYIYKWVKSIDGNLKAFHLTGDDSSGYWLKSVANSDGFLEDSEVVQCYYEYRR